MNHFRSFTIACLLLSIAVVGCGTASGSNEDVADPTVVSAVPTVAVATAVPTKPIPLAYPTPVDRTIDRYVVRGGDTLTKIAAQFDLDIQELMRLNGLSNPNAIYVGQSLRLPTIGPREAPAVYLLPDSEAVYGPTYASFDVTAFANQSGGYLASYREKVEGESLTGPQIIQLIAERYSVGPRVLLALLEYEGGWVTNKNLNQTQISYSMGLVDPGKATLFYQVSWAANRLNEGYYGKINGRLPAFNYKDRTKARVPPSVNPGSVALENVLALNSSYDAWVNQIGPSGFLATYRRLFGDPTPLDPLVPPGLQQPIMRLPWKSGSSWYFTGGPHSPWGDFAAWGAIDVTPRDVGGCAVSSDWAIAAAAGRVVRAEQGRVIISLSGNFQGSGWSLLYMHMAANGRVAEGTMVKQGDPIGHPSCEGGYGNASHLHFARLYNGQWIDPVSVPYILSAWQIVPSRVDYDGTMVRGDESREALNSKNEYKNAVTADDKQ